MRPSYSPSSHAANSHNLIDSDPLLRAEECEKDRLSQSLPHINAYKVLSIDADTYISTFLSYVRGPVTYESIALLPPTEAPHSQGMTRWIGIKREFGNLAFSFLSFHSLLTIYPRLLSLAHTHTLSPYYS